MRVLLLLVTLATTACGVAGSGVTATQSRPTADFTSVSAADGVRLEISRGPTSLTIEGDDNLLPLIKTEVVDGRLIIRKTTRESLRATRPIVLRLTTPSLSRLEASGGTDVQLADAAAPRFSADLSGGVDFEATGLELESFELHASGGVDVKAEGIAKAAQLTVSGGADVDARKLQVTHMAVDASGGCDLQLTALESIAGEASGGGSMEVHGHPANARVQTSGGASVDYRD
ncbi:MAG: head GIN domain-containing protein [Myxococcales bacterium]|nr:head GIN domain-containing protein [Myxococcales bacterium]